MGRQLGGIQRDGCGGCCCPVVEDDDEEMVAGGGAGGQVIEIGGIDLDQAFGQDEVGGLAFDLSGGEAVGGVGADFGSEESAREGHSVVEAQRGFGDEVIGDPADLPPSVLRVGARACVHEPIVVGGDAGGGIDKGISAQDGGAGHVAEERFAGEGVDADEESGMAGEEDRAFAIGRADGAAVFEAEAGLVDFPILTGLTAGHFRCGRGDGMGVDGGGVETGGGEGGLAIFFIVGGVVEIEHALGNLAGGEVGGEAGVAADAEEFALVDAVGDEPIGSALRSGQIFLIAERAVGDEQAVEGGTVIGEVGEGGAFGFAVVGDDPTAIRALPGEEAVGTEAEARAQFVIVRLKEEDVAEVDERVVGEADGFDVLAGFLGEDALFPEVVLAEGCSLEKAGRRLLLGEFEIEGVGQAILEEEGISGEGGEHPHGAVIGIFEGIVGGGSGCDW